MYKNKNILCVIPARIGSKGVKKKNLRKLLGKSLFEWPLDEAKKSKFVDKIIISSDSEKIVKTAKKKGVLAPFKRPKKISSDKSTSVDVVLHAINFLESRSIFFDYVILLEPTSPLTTFKDIDKAIKLLIDNRYAKSIVGVTLNIGRHPYFNYTIENNGIIVPFSKKIKNLRRQDLPTCYYLNGNLYISEVKYLKKAKSFYHNHTTGYTSEKWKSIEIDDEYDLIMTEAIISKING